MPHCTATVLSQKNKRGSGEESLLRESLEILGFAQGPPKINITDIDSPVVDATYVTFEVKWRTDEQTWALFHDGLLYLHSQVLGGDEDFLAGFFFATTQRLWKSEPTNKVQLILSWYRSLYQLRMSRLNSTRNVLGCRNYLNRYRLVFVPCPKGWRPQPPRGAVPFGQRSAAVCTEVPWHLGLGKSTMTLKHWWR